eukprot:scaffold37712_cov167-Skeletonema_dohrnii-CCMP3373.AAC.1
MVQVDRRVADVVAVKIEERTARRSALAFSTTWEFRRDEDTELVEKADALPVVMATARASDVTLMLLLAVVCYYTMQRSNRLGFMVIECGKVGTIACAVCTAGKSRGGSKFDFASS